MIVKNNVTGKYMIIKNNTTTKNYYEQIIQEQYNININIPNVNQVNKIKNLLNRKY